MAAPGSRLGPYEILSPLGAGGMGEVFLARDLALGRLAAIKVLPPAMTEEARRRLFREAQACARELGAEARAAGAAEQVVH